MRLQQITVYRSLTGESKAITAEMVSDDFAFHPSAWFYTPEETCGTSYTVTHVPSGVTLKSYLSREQAKWLALLCAGADMDWKAATPALIFWREAMPLIPQEEEED